MNRVLVFFLGFIAGIGTTFLGLFALGIYVIGDRGGYYDGDYDDSVLADDTVYIEEVAAPDVIENDSIEVKGRRGYVNLAVGMSKSEVRSKLGRPKTTEYSYGTETWKYEFPEEGSYGTARYMTIRFDDGSLKTINQY